MGDLLVLVVLSIFLVVCVASLVAISRSISRNDMSDEESGCHPQPPANRQDVKRNKGSWWVGLVLVFCALAAALYIFADFLWNSGMYDVAAPIIGVHNTIEKVVSYMPFIIVVLVVLVVLFRNIKVVPEAKAYTIERLGKYVCTWGAGLHLKIPFIDRISNKVSLKEQVFDFDPQSVITKDNVTMQIDTVVYLVIFDPRLATYGVEHVIPAIENLTATTLRNLVGDMTLDQTLTSRDTVNVKLQSMLDVATDPWGVKINRVELKNIMPPRDIQDAMEKQMRAEREKRESILRAEGSKESQILEATGRKEATILDAEAAKQKAILEAEAAQEAAIKRAEGEAQAIRKVKEAEAAGIAAIKAAGADDAVLQLEAYRALEQVSKGPATTLFVPNDLAGLAGAVATLKKSADESSK